MIELRAMSGGEQLQWQASLTDASLNLSSDEYFYLHVVGANGTAFCEGTPLMLCREWWRMHLNSLNEGASRVIDSAGVQPAGALVIVLLSLLVASCACCGAYLNRRRMGTRMRRLEEELSRLKRKERRFAEEGMPLHLEQPLE